MVLRWQVSMFDIAVGTVGSTLSRFSGVWYCQIKSMCGVAFTASRIVMLRRCIILASAVSICYGQHPLNRLIHN